MKLQTLLRVAWMSIILGIVIQMAQLVLVTILDKNSSIKIFIADFSNKLAWTYVVCASIALAAAITKNSLNVGLAGLISTPIGLYLATIIHKAVLKELSLSTTLAGSFVWAPVIIKAVEYACLGIMFAWLTRKQKSIFQFITAALSVGVIFGMLQIIYKINSPTKESAGLVNLLPLGLNELIIPVGCSIIIFASEILAKRIKLVN